MEILGDFFIPAYVLIAVLIGTVGMDKKAGFAECFFASLFFTPIAGLIVLFASESKITHDTQKLKAMKIAHDVNLLEYSDLRKEIETHRKKYKY